jgi:polyisoprenoid-binding protein YceI
VTKDNVTIRRGAALATVVALLGLAGDVVDGVALAADAPAASAKAPAGVYTLDKAHASLLLRVNHLGFSYYTTRFSRFDAELMFDPNSLSASSVVATIDAASLEMDGAPAACLDIVRGPQMLDVGQYPRITFRSERVRVTGSNTLRIAGSLSVHGVTRPIVLGGTFNGGYAGHPMDPRARIGLSAHGSFKRSDFGIGFGVPAPGTTMGVGDQIDVTIEAEFSGPPLAAQRPAAH